LGPSELLDQAIGNCFAADFSCEVTTVWIKRGKFMERLAFGSAVIGLMFLISWPSAFAAGQQGFSIKVFTSPDDQFWANSVIIEGAREVMLVDAQLTKTMLKKYCSKSKKLRSRCPLSTLPMRTPTIFLVWRFLRRHIRE